MMKNSNDKTMWGGRFSDDPDAFMVEFGASIEVDITLLDADVAGSIAWVKALEKAGILTKSELEEIIGGLETVQNDIRSELADGTFLFDKSLEDIHMTVESRLTKLIGDTGAKLHTGRSRNDQVALDERLYLLSALPNLAAQVTAVQKSILQKAKSHVDDVVPSYTHLQQALPVRLGHYLMAWFWMLERDKGRILDARKRADSLPLGAGAVAGSGFPVDRKFIAETLGFSSVSENSIDTVSDRDSLIETLTSVSMLMMHLSRISEDLIIWSSAEFGFSIMPDAYSTGSSMMPQKKNPDSLELVRGKTGRVYGDLVTLLTIMKGLSFSYCKDMQEDKEPLFDALLNAEGCLRIVKGVIDGVRFKTGKMKSSFDDSVFATDVADYLTAKGLPFRQAHEVAGKLVRWSQENDTAFRDIPFEIFNDHSSLFAGDVYKLFDLLASTDRRSLEGGTGRKALLEQLEKADSIIGME